jgi:hypothetical protein
MLYFFSLRRELLGSGTFQVIDLKGLSLYGATAYIVNSRSKEKMLGLIDGLSSYELPYDIQLRNWVDTGYLKAGVTFPFLTTLSSHSDHSTIQSENSQMADRVLNAYRRLIWMDFEQTQENPMESLSKLDASYFDTQSLFFSQILSVILSSNFVNR